MFSQLRLLLLIIMEFILFCKIPLNMGTIPESHSVKCRMWSIKIKVYLSCLACLPVVLSECRVTIPLDLPKSNAPVYLTANNKLWAMNANSQLVWRTNQESKLMCSGPGNTLTLNKKAITTIKCVSGKTFMVDGKSKNFRLLGCTKKITGDIQTTRRTCAKGIGSVINIGFGADKTFATFIETCYKKSTGTTLYTSHILHGNAVFSGCVTENRAEFKTDATIPQVTKKIRAAYELVNQKTKFTKQSVKLGNRITPNTMLVKGHLTPYCDAVFPTWKHATQFYINVVPEFRRVNGGNWVRVEALARNKAKALKRDLQIFTGIHQIINQDNVNMHLIDNRLLEVPKWFWKVIRDPLTGQGIAFITLNNVFATTVPSLCPNICESASWDHKAFKDKTRGYTYCCAVNKSLLRTIPNIPAAAESARVLEYSNAIAKVPKRAPVKRPRGRVPSCNGGRCG